MEHSLRASTSSLVSSTSFLSPPSLCRFSFPWRSQSILSRAPSCMLSSFCNFKALRSSRLATSSFIPFAGAYASEALAVPNTTSSSMSEFIEIGYISDVHGLQGEVCIKHNTDFPEMRFSEPGVRWLRQQVSGRENVTEVELVEGRGCPGKKTWIVKFDGFNSIDEAKPLVGATVLVRENDRPELQEDEYYSRDLLGMRVIMKETSKPVGTVINVFNQGGSDLLHVMLNPSQDFSDGNSKEEPDTNGSGALVWIPFVEAIVPDVDLDKREMWITPPKGLLQLNIHSHEHSKKERRLLEWKERKKAQRRLIVAKKKLCSMEQEHVFHGLRYGDKPQRSLLADEIVSVNSELLVQALQNMEISSLRSYASEITNLSSKWNTGNKLKIPENHPDDSSKVVFSEHSGLRESGLDLVSQGKLAAVLVLNSGKGKSFEAEGDHGVSLLGALLSDGQRIIQADKRSSVPLIMISPPAEVEALERLFSSNDFFGFNKEKVWFLAEENLPVLSIPTEEPKKHKILMKSPWEILREPVGSGGVVTALSSSSILGDLTEMGVEYVEMCCITQRSAVGLPIFLGFVDSCGAEIGIQVFKDELEFEDNFHLIASMESMNKLIQASSKLRFHAVPKLSKHGEYVNKEWIDVTPDSANSYELKCSIYSLLSSLPTDQVCLLEVV